MALPGPQRAEIQQTPVIKKNNFNKLFQKRLKEFFNLNVKFVQASVQRRRVDTIIVNDEPCDTFDVVFELLLHGSRLPVVAVDRTVFRSGYEVFSNDL